METILPAPILTHLFSIRCQVDPRVETGPVHWVVEGV